MPTVVISGIRGGYLRQIRCGKTTQAQKDLYEEARAVWYDGMNVIKDGAADYDVPEKWPDSPQYWGYDSWDEVTAYCITHGLGLTLHDGPAINMTKMARWYPPSTPKEGMSLVIETYAGHKGGKDGVRREENILVTKDGYEFPSRWPIAELMECWIHY